MEKPAVTITGSTPNEIIETIGDNEAILKRFDSVRKLANAADAERDRLRDYIKERIEPGKYGQILFTFKNAGTRAYANSSGLNAIQNYVVVAPTERHEDIPIETGMDLTVRNDKGEIIWRGKLVDNQELYTKSVQQNITIAEIPS